MLQSVLELFEGLFEFEQTESRNIIFPALLPTSQEKQPSKQIDKFVSGQEQRDKPLES